MLSRRGKLFLLILALLLAAVVIPLAGCGSDESADLDPTKIAEYNKPGTVLVETIWTADVSFPELALDYDALVQYIINAALDGTIPVDATEDEIAAAMVAELVTYPENYLYASTEDRVTTMETSVYGSGFVIRDDGHVITNAHVVKKSDEELAAAMAEENAGELLMQDLAAFEEELGIDLPPEYEDYFLAAAADLYATYYTVSSPKSETSVFLVAVGDKSLSDAIPAEIMEVGDPTDMNEETGKDVAVLKVNESNMPTVPLGDDTDLMDGEQVLALGYPGVATFDYNFDLESEISPTLTQGTVSAQKTMSGGWEVIQTDAYITNGSSGSPLLNMKGEAIAVNTFGVGELSETTGEYQEKAGYNFAIPATVIKEFLDKANVEPATGTLTETYHEAIDLFMDKHYSAAKEKFQEIHDANSEFPYVQDYIEQSSAKISAGEDVSTFPVPIWLLAVIIGGIVVVVIIVIVLVVRSGGKDKGSPPQQPQASVTPPPAPAAPTEAAPAAPAAETPPATTDEAAATREMPATEVPTADDAAGPEPDRFCSKCGNEVGEGAEFCSKCGNPVGS